MAAYVRSDDDIERDAVWHLKGALEYLANLGSGEVVTISRESVNRWLRLSVSVPCFGDVEVKSTPAGDALREAFKAYLEECIRTAPPERLARVVADFADQARDSDRYIRKLQEIAAGFTSGPWAASAPPRRGAAPAPE
jgi:hypothetical protein